GAADDPESEAHHRFDDVESFVIAPGGDESFRVLLHDFGVVSHALVGEGRGDEAAALEVEIAFAGEESVTEDGTGDDAEDRTFDEIFGALDQDFGDEVGVVDQHHAEAPEIRAADAGDIGGNTLD